MACSMANYLEATLSLAALRIEARFPEPGQYHIHLCDQCGHCAQVCPAEAIYEENGRFLVDADACIGCETCVEECPNQVMTMHPGNEEAVKCTLCGDCAALCPRQAILFEEADKKEAVA